MPRRRRHNRSRSIKSKASKFARFIKRYIGSRKRRGHGLAEMRNIYNKLFEINEVMNQLQSRVLSGISDSEQIQISAMLDRIMANTLMEHGPEMAQTLPEEHAEIVEEIEPENVEPEVYDEIAGDVDEVGDEVGDEGDEFDEFDEGDELIEGEALHRRRRRKGTRRTSGTSTAALRRKHPRASAAQIRNWARFAAEHRKGARGGGKSKNSTLSQVKELLNLKDKYEFKDKAADRDGIIAKKYIRY